MEDTRLSLALALQDDPPIISPGEEAPLTGAGREVLVMAGSEKDMFPGWIGLHACSRTVVKDKRTCLATQ